MTEQALRALVADYSRRLHAQGWVANHDGNISVRLDRAARSAAVTDRNRFLCTPGATSKAQVTAESLLVVDPSGARSVGCSKAGFEPPRLGWISADRPPSTTDLIAHL